MLAVLESLAPGRATVAALADQDWVTMSQAGLDPVNVGRFHVHTGAHAGLARPGAIALRIDAGQAFGTAHHPTTAGCLAVLCRLQPRLRVRRMLDLGTGSGLLAFAAQRLWRRAAVTASDIDAVAIVVARENAGQNAVPTGQRRGAVHLLAAPGLEHRDLARRGPYDLIVANILAGPLVGLAPGIVASLAPGGVLVLAGLLRGQAPRVLAAYQGRGLVQLRGVGADEWPVLILRRPGSARPAAGIRRGVRETAGRRPTASAW
jgi:ribosomal protein L11 methyltransferase